MGEGEEAVGGRVALRVPLVALLEGRVLGKGLRLLVLVVLQLLMPVLLRVLPPPPPLSCEGAADGVRYGVGEAVMTALGQPRVDSQKGRGVGVGVGVGVVEGEGGSGVALEV